MCRHVLVEDMVSAETIEGQRRSSRDESKGVQAGSTTDCIVHLRPLQQGQRGGQPASSAPEWLSGVGALIRTWLQHWLKPRHLKGEDFRLTSLPGEMAGPQPLWRLSRPGTLLRTWLQHWLAPGTRTARGVCPLSVYLFSLGG